MNETTNPTLQSLIGRLLNAPVCLLPDEETWKEMIARIKQPGRLTQIEEETYRYFLEVLPPHYQGADCFAFAEGREPLKLFLRNGIQNFCRQLTWEETVEFCQAAKLSLPQ